MLDLSSQEGLVLLAAACVAGFVRGFTGFGAALVFIPVAARVLEPAEAVVLMLVMDVAGTVQLLPEGLREGDRRAAGQLVLGGVFGVPIGVWLLTQADPVVFRWAASILALFLLALIVAGVRLRGRPGPGTRGSVGFISGLMSGFSGMGGPPVILFELGGGARPVSVRANIILFFTANVILSAVNFGFRGLVTGQIVLLGLLLTVPNMISIAAGARLFRRSGDVLFRRLAYILVGGAALAGLPVWGGG